MNFPEATDAEMEEFLHRCPNCLASRERGRDDCRRCGATAEFCRELDKVLPFAIDLLDLQRTAAALDRLIAQMPWSVCVLDLRITVAIELGDTVAALRCLRMLFDCAEILEDALWARARLLMHAGDYEHALADLEAALRRYPTDNLVELDLERVRERLDDYDGEFAA
jgi:tetratricopeptide (TPR) repeat protein